MTSKINDLIHEKWLLIQKLHNRNYNQLPTSERTSNQLLLVDIYCRSQGNVTSYDVMHIIKFISTVFTIFWIAFYSTTRFPINLYATVINYLILTLPIN